MSEWSDPALFVFYKNWASQAALDVHLETPHLQDITLGLQCTAFCRTILQREDSMPLAHKKQQKQIRKIERIEARLNAEQKRRIEYAASLKGTSISDFMVSSADDAAVQTIQQHEVWTLTDRDRKVFVEALLHPPAPSARMKAAVRRYLRRIGDS